MGLCSCAGRMILIVLNLAILIVSLGLVIVGLLLKYGPGIILQPLFNLLLDSSSEVDVRKSAFNLPDLTDVKELPFIDEIGLFLIVFGLVLFCISFLAFCGACCTCRIVLILYVILMCVMVLVQGIIGGMFLAEESPIHDAIQESVGKKITDRYNRSSHDAFSSSINIFQLSLDCCGIRGPKDFLPDNVPPSCCKSDYLTNSSYTLTVCTSAKWNGTGDDFIFNHEGCYPKLMGEVQDNIVWAGIGFALLLLLQVLEIAFAISVIKNASLILPV